MRNGKAGGSKNQSLIGVNGYIKNYNYQGSQRAGKMRDHFPVREKSGDFDQTGKVR